MLNLKHQLILGSGSPRRKTILKEVIADFEVRIPQIEELYPDDLPFDQIAVYLAELKSEALNINANEMLLTSDTVVRNNQRIFEKPQDKAEAKMFLHNLQDTSHFVDTAVCIRTMDKKVSFTITSKVYFCKLDETEIEYYIDQYKPFDKAGAYGIQEWIGYIGIERIEGDYQAIVGFPISAIYQTLKAWY